MRKIFVSCFLSIVLILFVIENISANKYRKFCIIESVKELKEKDFLEGDYVKTLGYYLSGDGGGNEFRIVVSDNLRKDNGGTVIKLKNGNFAISILDKDDINIKHFGAKNNANAHSDVYFKKYVEWCKNERDYVVKLPAMVLSLYETYTFLPNESGNNIKIIGEHKVEHQYSKEITINKNYDSESGTVIYSHASDGILFDIQNKSLYAGIVLEGIALYGNRKNTLAVRIVSGGQELKIHDVAVLNFNRGAIHFNNVYDGYITNLTIKGCGMFYDGTSHPALRFYTDKKECKIGDLRTTNTNALHFTNFHFEHCDCFCSFEKCADLFFVNGKIESMSGEGVNNAMDPIKSSHPFVCFKGEGGTVSFNSVFFKTPSTARMMNSNQDVSLEELPYFIEFKENNIGTVSFSDCMFLSYNGGGIPIKCESKMTHATITNSIFKRIATGRNAIKANNLTLLGCTLYFENDGFLYMNNRACKNIISEEQKGYPIKIGDNCAIIACKLIFEKSRFSGVEHTHYNNYLFDGNGINTIIKDNILISSDIVVNGYYNKNE